MLPPLATLLRDRRRICVCCRAGGDRVEGDAPRLPMLRERETRLSELAMRERAFLKEGGVGPAAAAAARSRNAFALSAMIASAALSLLPLLASLDPLQLPLPSERERLLRKDAEWSLLLPRARRGTRTSSISRPHPVIAVPKGLNWSSCSYALEEAATFEGAVKRGSAGAWTRRLSRASARAATNPRAIKCSWAASAVRSCSSS